MEYASFSTIFRPNFFRNKLDRYFITFFIHGVFLFPLNLCVTIDWISNNCFPCFATSAGMVFTLSYLNSRTNFMLKSSYLYVSKFSTVYTSPTFLLLPQKISFCLFKIQKKSSHSNDIILSLISQFPKVLKLFRASNTHPRKMANTLIMYIILFEL